MSILLEYLTFSNKKVTKLLSANCEKILFLREVKAFCLFYM